MRLSSGRCAPRFVLPDEAGARRPIFFAALLIRRTHMSFSNAACIRI
jgi:hypothetical protein